MEKKSKFFTLIYSCYPGGGHMYLGFMKQGVQLMLLFSVIFALSSYSRIFRGLTFFMPILVAYSIFDAMNKRSSITQPDDSDLDLFKWFNIQNTGKLQAMNYYRVGVYILIIVGVYILVDNVGFTLMKEFLYRWFDGEQRYTFDMIERAIKSAVWGIIFIVGGIKLQGRLKQTTLVEQEKIDIRKID